MGHLDLCDGNNLCDYSKKHCPFPPNKHCLTWPVEVSWAKECSLDIPVVVVNDV